MEFSFDESEVRAVFPFKACNIKDCIFVGFVLNVFVDGVVFTRAADLVNRICFSLLI